MTERERIVINTGPLLALSGVERLDILDALYDDVLVPQQVHDEVLQGSAMGRDMSAYENANFLHITTLAMPPDPILGDMLDQGEAAVIQLARQEHIARILIDERKGRKIARQVYGLSVLGTMRLLINAKRANLLHKVGGLIQRMREQGYWIHEAIVQAAYGKLEKSKQRMWRYEPLLWRRGSHRAMGGQISVLPMTLCLKEQHGDSTP